MTDAPTDPMTDAPTDPMTDAPTDPMTDARTDPLVMVYQDNHHLTMVNTFKSYLDEETFVDLIFICRGNKRVGAHQLVFGSISGMFLQLIAENSRTACEKILHINVPEIRAKLLKKILEFLYIGKAQLYRSELEEFSENLKLLGLPLNFPNFDNSNGTSNLIIETVDLTTASESDVNLLENLPNTVSSSNHVPDVIPNVSPSVSDTRIENSTLRSSLITSSNPVSAGLHSSSPKASESSKGNLFVRSSAITTTNSTQPDTHSDSSPSVPISPETANSIANSSQVTMSLPAISNANRLASEASSIISSERKRTARKSISVEKPSSKVFISDTDRNPSISSMILTKSTNRTNTNNFVSSEESVSNVLTESINLDSDDD